MSDENKSLIEIHFDEIVRYSASLGLIIEEEDQIYYEGRLAISKRSSCENWILTDNNGKYILLHESSNIRHRGKVRYHKQFESESRNLCVKRLFTCHGLEYYKKPDLRLVRHA